MVAVAAAASTSCWRLKVGFEVHARILCKSKLLSGAAASFDIDAAPNSRVAFQDCGMPGSLPRVNTACVDAAVKTGLALGAQVRLLSVFERKHYFYGDQPLGFQVTQQRWPIAVGGALQLSYVDDRGLARAKQELRKASVRITRIQLEQDTGRSLEIGGNTGGTLIDLNRAGARVMEIVTEPDIDSAPGAVAFCSEMRELLEAIGTCDGNMQDGSLRFDVNVSVHGDNGINSHRVEVKNLNSFRSVERAIIHEQERLIRIYSGADSPKSSSLHETRAFNFSTGNTEALRSKDSAAEYRFFPDPDIPPLVISRDRVDRIRTELPELPEAQLHRLVTQCTVNEIDARKLVAEPGGVRYLEDVVAQGQGLLAPARVAGWLVNEVMALAHAN